MSDGGAIENFETRGLDKLLKALKEKPPMARVGILAANSGARQAKAGTKPPTNYLIGLVHEFGSPSQGIAQRSFLRMPITEHLPKMLQKSDFFTKETLDQVIKDGTVIYWLRGIAAHAKAIVLEAFDTGGFGKWAPWVNKNYTNNTGQLLMDTGQLRESITDEVKAGG